MTPRPGLKSLAVAAVLIGGAATAQAPAKLGYQGRLLSAAGTPQSGTHALGFSLFAAPTGGAALWSETQQLGLSDGYYATTLGSATPAGCSAAACTGVPKAVFDGAERYLELTVDGQVLAPRQVVASVAYALKADSAFNVSGGVVNAASVAVAGSPVIDATGKYVGPATVTASPPLAAAGTVLSLSACTAANQTLVWSGSSWGCGAAAAQGTAGGDLSGTFPNPTVVALRGVAVAATAPAAGDVLRFTGADWSPASLPLAAPATPGVMRVGVGLGVDAGVVGLAPCPAGQALVSSGPNVWACARVPSGANTLAQFTTYTLQVQANPAPPVSCTAGDVALGCTSVSPGGGSVCGTAITDGTCITSGCAATYATIVTCLKLR